MYDIILMAVIGLALLVGTYSDIKKREVADWVNYGLIFSALGLRAIFSIEGGYQVLLGGLIGLAAATIISLALYYTNMWGGGDSKLLMGVGAAVGVWKTNLFDLGIFFLGLLLLGAVFGLFWSVGLAVRQGKVFWKEFADYVRNSKKAHLFSWIVAATIIGLSTYRDYLWPMIFLPVGSFYLLSFVKTVEKSCFIKEKVPSELVEGDWLAEDIFLGNDRIAKGKALEKEDVWRIRFEKKKVMIKEGVPFVPGFLLSYAALLLLKLVIFPKGFYI